MGQRLVISIYGDHETSEPLAAVYLHWSAYTMTAYCELYELLSYLDEEKDNCISKEDWQRAVASFYQNRKYSDEKAESLNRIAGGRQFQKMHGGIDEDDRPYVREHWKDFPLPEENYDRNLGLVAVTPSGIKDLQSYSEGDARIYLDDMSADNDVWFSYSKDDFVHSSQKRVWEIPDYEIEMPDKAWEDMPKAKCSGMSLAYLEDLVHDKKIGDFLWDNGFAEDADDNNVVLEALT